MVLPFAHKIEGGTHSGKGMGLEVNTQAQVYVVSKYLALYTQVLRFSMAMAFWDFLSFGIVDIYHI